jgi:hypothetical protein
MKGFVKIYTVVTTIQLTVIILSLCVSTLGIVLKHPFIIYFWYLSLSGIAMMMATSFLIGVALLLTRLFAPHSSRERQGWFSRPKGIHV